MVQITLCVDGERQFLEIPVNTPLSKIAECVAILQGKPIGGYRVNGAPGLEGQMLQAGDRITAVPAAGIQG